MLDRGQPVPGQRARRAGFDGPGPNPLLQNHILMAFHPPMLYLGYVGFTVPFAFAIAALVTGRVGEGWLVETRRWTLFAWGFLTVGIVLGAWWSYEVLGWGGYWGWDPVENASLLPWLTGTAYLHSVMVQERRGMLRVWNLSLLCATFSLTILGTFLTRSGVVESVHAFTESSIGAAAARLLRPDRGRLGRAHRLAGRPPAVRRVASTRRCRARARSWPTTCVFAAFAFVVLLGTVFPLVDRGAAAATALGRAAVLQPHDHADRPHAAVPHGGGPGAAVAQGLRGAAARPAARGRRGPVSARWCSAVAARWPAASPRSLAFGLGGFAAGSALRQIVLATRRQGWRGFVGRANGGMVVHLGVIMIGVALAASMSYVQPGRVRPGAGPDAPASPATRSSTWARATVDLPNRVELVADLRIDGGQVY